MAKAKKLPSGMWRVLVYSHTELVDGKPKRKYKSFTAADKRAAELMAAEYKAGKEPQEKNGRERITLEQAIDRYIAAKGGVLSPTTLAEYKRIKTYAFQDIMSACIYDITRADLQAAITKESSRTTFKKTVVSPKTVINEYGLLSAALKFFDIQFNVTLPKVPEKFVELPPPDEIFEMFRGTEIELPCLLACWLSFSASEIRGIKCSSIRKNVLYIEQVLVDVNGRPTEKKTGKAEKRLRAHRLPPYIMELIKAQETYKEYKRTGTDCYLIPLSHTQLYGKFKRITRKHGYEMTFHQLRHLNASVMLALNVPEKYAMERGGWKTPHTMKKVYQHTFSDERKKVDDMVDEYFENIVEGKMQHEMQHKEKER